MKPRYYRQEGSESMRAEPPMESDEPSEGAGKRVGVCDCEVRAGMLRCLVNAREGAEPGRAEWTEQGRLSACDYCEAAAGLS